MGHDRSESAAKFSEPKTIKLFGPIVGSSITIGNRLHRPPWNVACRTRSRNAEFLPSLHTGPPNMVLIFSRLAHETGIIISTRITNDLHTHPRAKADHAELHRGDVPGLQTAHAVFILVCGVVRSLANMPALWARMGRRRMDATAVYAWGTAKEH